jgi:hypothetical protein
MLLRESYEGDFAKEVRSIFWKLKCTSPSSASMLNMRPELQSNSFQTNLSSLFLMSQALKSWTGPRAADRHNASLSCE